MKRYFPILLIILASCGEKKFQYDYRHYVEAGFSTESFMKGKQVGNMGGGRSYRYDQSDFNAAMDCDSFTIHYSDPINQTFIFVRQQDSTWKQIK